MASDSSLMIGARLRLGILLVAMVVPSWLSGAEQPDDVKGKIKISGSLRVRSSSSGDLPVKDAIVYLWETKAVGQSKDLAAVRVEARNGQLRQKHLSVVVGQKLVIEMAQDEPYVFKLDVPGDEAFGMSLPPPEKTFERVFRRPSPNVVVRCAIHPNLIGHITVTPNLYAGRTDDAGNFQLFLSVPPGDYEVRAFHPTYGTSAAKFSITKGDTVVKVDLLCRAKS